MKLRNSVKRDPKKAGISISERIRILENQLKQLSSELGCKEQLNQIFSKESSDTYSKLINIDIVFLLDENEDKASGVLADWLGVEEGDICYGNTLSLDYEKLGFDLKFYHYQDKPVLRVSDIKPVIKIIVYGDAYAKKKDFELILKETGIDAPCCLLISLRDKDTELNDHKLCLYAHSLLVLNSEISELEKNGFVDLLSSDSFKSKLKLMKWFNRITDLSLASNLMDEKLKSRKQLIQNGHLLNQKEILKYQAKEGEISSKNIGSIKSSISKGYKSVYRMIEQLKSELERKGEGSFIDEMKNYVDGHDKFIEEKKGKNTILKIPAGVLDDVVNKTVHKVQKDFNSETVKVREKLLLIEKKIQQHFKKLAIPSPILPSKILSDSITNDVVAEHMVLEKTYEKSMTPKGMSHLFSEIRTPLFMIMPLMMFAGIFGSFFITEDYGVISKETQYEKRNAIIIDALPRKYKAKGLASFAENQIFSRSGMRNLSKPDKEHGEIFQLAMRIVQEKKKIGRKITSVPKKVSDYKIVKTNKRNKKLVLFLAPKGEREWVINQLMNPENNLLSISDTSKGGGGMGMLYGLGTAFGKYRFLVLGLIVALFSWFIKKKLGEFKTEASYSLRQSKDALAKDLKSEVDKMVRKSTAVWNAGIVGHVKKQEEMHQEVVVNSLAKVIEGNKDTLQEQLQIVQRRAANFDDDDKQNKDFYKELNKIQEDLFSIKKKFSELIYS